jgi:hypothetical protein
MKDTTFFRRLWKCFTMSSPEIYALNYIERENALADEHCCSRCNSISTWSEILTDRDEGFYYEPDGSITLINFLLKGKSRLMQSREEALRSISTGAVSVNGAVEFDPERKLLEGATYHIQITYNSKEQT